uniref:Uncharacterized protein n=1 Tax=Peronospora matthiolae TaxID=2874970 RepID=A0AAV1TFH1_9STRA
MSPKYKSEAGATAQAKLAKVTDLPNKTAGKQLEEKSAAPMGTMDKMMAMVGDISDTMNFLGAGVTLQALDGDLSWKKSPTDFGAMRQDFGYVGLHRGKYGGAEARMGAVPESTHPRQETPPDMYPGVGMPDRFFADEDPQVYGMPDAKDRKLALQSFNVKELYL